MVNWEPVDHSEVGTWLMLNLKTPGPGRRLAFQVVQGTISLLEVQLLFLEQPAWHHLALCFVFIKEHHPDCLAIPSLLSTQTRGPQLGGLLLAEHCWLCPPWPWQILQPRGMS